MRFFDRTEEIASLKEILELSKSNAQFTVVPGRRRIGKMYHTKSHINFIVYGSIFSIVLQMVNYIIIPILYFGRRQG